jgi:hypothetical protein
MRRMDDAAPVRVEVQRMEPDTQPSGELMESRGEGSYWHAPARRPAGGAGRRWLVLAGLGLAFALVLGLGIMIGAVIQPSAQAASFTPGNAIVGQGPQFPGFPGARQAPFASTPGAQGPCDALTVSSVSGSTIVASASDGSSVTIHTTSSTQYTKAGQAATAAAVTVGARIHVDGSRASDGSITATRIDVQ